MKASLDRSANSSLVPLLPLSSFHTNSVPVVSDASVASVERAETPVAEVPLASASPVQCVPIECVPIECVPVQCVADQAATVTQSASTPLPDIETTHVWGIDFAVMTMEQVVDRADRVIAARSPRYFITANLNYLMLTADCPDLPKINSGADLIMADGNPIVWRSALTLQRLPQRVAGSDLIVELARLSAQRGYSIYFLGGAPGVAQKAASKLHEMFPSLKIAGCAAPPFRALTSTEQEQLLSDITHARPDILLVAFGQPKGERWIAQHHRQLNVPLSIQLGASFDFLAGTARRAPAFWQKIGCEWLYRSICEPRRLAPRYARNIAFLCRHLMRDFT